VTSGGADTANAEEQPISVIQQMHDLVAFMKTPHRGEQPTALRAAGYASSRTFTLPQLISETISPIPGSPIFRAITYGSGICFSECLESRCKLLILCDQTHWSRTPNEHNEAHGITRP
jgi:hypothetical protein